MYDGTYQDPYTYDLTTFAGWPPDSSVSAAYHLVTQLTHRQEIYQFPTPFMRGDYRVEGEAPPDPSTLDYVLLDAEAWYDTPVHEQLYEALLRPAAGSRSSTTIVLLPRTDDPLSSLVRSFAPIGL